MRVTAALCFAAVALAQDDSAEAVAQPQIISTPAAVAEAEVLSSPASSVTVRSSIPFGAPTSRPGLLSASNRPPANLQFGAAAPRSLYPNVFGTAGPRNYPSLSAPRNGVTAPRQMYNGNMYGTYPQSQSQRMYGQPQPVRVTVPRPQPQPQPVQRAPVSPEITSEQRKAWLDYYAHDLKHKGASASYLGGVLEQQDSEENTHAIFTNNGANYKVQHAELAIERLKLTGDYDVNDLAALEYKKNKEQYSMLQKNMKLVDPLVGDLAKWAKVGEKKAKADTSALKLKLAEGDSLSGAQRKNRREQDTYWSTVLPLLLDEDSKFLKKYQKDMDKKEKIYDYEDFTSDQEGLESANKDLVAAKASYDEDSSRANWYALEHAKADQALANIDFVASLSAIDLMDADVDFWEYQDLNELSVEARVAELKVQEAVEGYQADYGAHPENHDYMIAVPQTRLGSLFG